MNKLSPIRELTEFLVESNAIEKEYSKEALQDAYDAWKFVELIDLLTVADILKTHEILMKTIRPDIAGNYRTCDVSIGGKIKKYLGSDFLESQLIDVVNFITESFKLETDEERTQACKQAHIMFENIHPFEDGNGRTGRIIYNWHRIKLGLPLHIINRGIEQYEYYEWFN